MLLVNKECRVEHPYSYKEDRPKVNTILKGETLEEFSL